MTNNEFIQLIAPIIVKYARKNGYKYPSAIIAQACNESGYGRSTLGKNYHNYFGMKCGSSWVGKSVNLKTKEEYVVGSITEISGNFRVFDNMEDGVKGYFDFINKTRYANLKSATSPKNYLELIKKDGYATSSSYVENVYAVVVKQGLNKYDTPDSTIESKTVDEVAIEVIAGLWGNGSERRQNLEYSGYDYECIQAKVNEILSKKKSNEEIAKEVIRGLWGKGSERKRKLTSAGYDYNVVQTIVNNILK